ncbi:MAG: SPOR domain-containing protein [Gammaproteobacteria bacterium]|nr:SPOR domain-containing protein [Gammaproteobacteria bacterium]
MNIKTNYYTGLLAALVLIIGLSGCSSKPSPWSQQGSPWGEKADAPAEEASSPSPWDEPAVPEIPPEPVIVEEAPVMQSVAGDIMSQPSDYYVVQLCASSSMDKLLKFARRYDLPEQWTAQTSVRGKTWYVLMLGVYPTRGEAESALSYIRNKPLPTRPWIRTAASVQAVAR